MVFEELGIPYDTIDVPFANVKEPDYLKINPNGRLPAIHDPNTGLTLWESGAIVQYLIEKYDIDHKISFPGDSNEAYLAQQWLFYQVSGQGPYYGQSVWFAKYHPEKLPSAVNRYIREIARVTGVLEKHLSDEKEKAGGHGDGPWLVGNKYSYADLAFVSWQKLFHDGLLSNEDDSFNPEDFPVVKDWMARLTARPAIEKGLLGNK